MSHWYFSRKNKPSLHLSDPERDVPHIEASGLAGHLAAHDGHLSWGGSDSGGGGRSQQCDGGYLPGR